MYCAFSSGRTSANTRAIPTAFATRSAVVIAFAAQEYRGDAKRCQIPYGPGPKWGESHR